MLEFCSLDGGDDGEHNGVVFVEISEILVKQKTVFFGIGSFDRIYFPLQ